MSIVYGTEATNNLLTNTLAEISENVVSYNFADSTNLGKDSSGRNFTATNTGSVTYNNKVSGTTTGSRTNVATFSGSNSLDLTPAFATLSAMTGCCISCWFRVTAANFTGTTKKIFSFTETNAEISLTINTVGASPIALVLSVTNSTPTVLLRYVIFGSSGSSTPTVNLADGNWHHIAINLGANPNSAYLDNVAMASANDATNSGLVVNARFFETGDATTASTFSTVFTTMTVGKLGSAFVGDLCKVKIYNRNLTSIEIDYIYDYELSTYSDTPSLQNYLNLLSSKQSSTLMLESNTDNLNADTSNIWFKTNGGRAVSQLTIDGTTSDTIFNLGDNSAGTLNDLVFKVGGISTNGVDSANTIPTFSTPPTEVFRLSASLLTIPPITFITNTTISTSSTVGALKTSGGLSVAKNMWLGENLTANVSGTSGALFNIPPLTLTEATTATNSNLFTIGQPTYTITGTHTSPATMYVGGPPIKSGGTFNNAYGLYIAQGSAIGTVSTLAASLYIQNAPSVTTATPYAIYIAAGNSYFNGDMTITGSLTVSGTVTSISSTNLNITDPLIGLATNNTATDVVDIGFWGRYGSSGTKYTGLVRDASNSQYYLFTGLTEDISGLTVITSTLTTAANQAVLNVNTLRTSSTTTASSTTTGSLICAGGLGIAGHIFMANAKQIYWADINWGIGSNISAITTEVLTGNVLQFKCGETISLSGFQFINTSTAQPLVEISTFITETVGVKIHHTSAATSATVGGLAVVGGVAIAKNMWLGSSIGQNLSTLASAGIIFNIPAGITFTDGSAGATYANGNLFSIGQPTYTSTNAITITNAATSYIAGAPIKSTSTTFTNTYGLYIAATASVVSATTAASLGIAGAPTGGTINYALRVIAGNSYFGGNILMNNTNIATITLATQGGERTYTIADAGGAANFIMSSFTGGQTISTLLTLSGGLTVTTGALNLTSTSGAISLAGTTFSTNTAMSITAATNQLVLGSNTTITVPNPGGARVYTIADAGSAANFIMSSFGSEQTITGGLISARTTDITGSEDGYYFTINAAAVTNSGLSNDINFSYFGIPTLSGNTASTAATLHIAGAPAGTVTTPYALRIASGNSYFAGNIIMNNNNTATITLASQLGVRTYTIPDAGVTAASFVMSSGDSNISNTRTFSGAILMTGQFYTTRGAQITSGTSNIYINPNATAGTANPFYYTYFTAPSITGATLPTLSATVYIAGAPTLATPAVARYYALNILADCTSIGGATTSSLSTTTEGNTLNIPALTYTDNITGVGTVANANTCSIHRTTLASTNAITVTNAASLYIDNAPTAVANITITNAYALQVASGNSLFGGAIRGADGTLSIPTYSFTSDPDTGMYSSGVGALDFTVAGDNDMRLTPTGLTLGYGGTPSLHTGADFGLHIKGQGTDKASQINLEGSDGDSWLSIWSGATTTNGPTIVFPSTDDLRFGKATSVAMAGYTEVAILNNSTQFYPAVDNAGSLGISANRWGNVYSVLGNFEGAVTIPTTGSVLSSENDGVVLTSGSVALTTNNIARLTTTDTAITSTLNLVMPAASSIYTLTNNDGILFTSTSVALATNGTARLTATDTLISSTVDISVEYLTNGKFSNGVMSMLLNDDRKLECLFITDVTDSSGNGYNGTNVNSVTISTGATFNATNNYIHYDSHVANFITPEWTLSFFFPSMFSVGATIFSMGNSAADTYLDLGVGGSLNLFLKIVIAGVIVFDSNNWINTNNKPTTNVIVSMSVVGNFRVYVDNVLEVTASYYDISGITFDQMTLGALRKNGTTTAYLNNSIRRFRIYTYGVSLEHANALNNVADAETGTGLQVSYKNGTDLLNLNGTKCHFLTGTITVPDGNYIGNTSRNSLVQFDTSSIKLSTSSTDRLTIGTTNITSTLPFRADAGAVGTPSYSFTSDIDTGMYLPAVGQLGLSVGGSNIIQIISNTTNVTDIIFGKVTDATTLGLGNYLRFAGTAGDIGALLTIIAERVYDASAEKSELLLFKGNDFVSGVGPDRIRLRAAEHVFQTYTVAETPTQAGGVGTVITVVDDQTRLTIGTTKITSTVNLVMPAASSIYTLTNNDGILFTSTSVALATNATARLTATDTVIKIFGNQTLYNGEFDMGTTDRTVTLTLTLNSSNTAQHNSGIMCIEIIGIDSDNSNEVTRSYKYRMRKILNAGGNAAWAITVITDDTTGTTPPTITIDGGTTLNGSVYNLQTIAIQREAGTMAAFTMVVSLNLIGRMYMETVSSAITA